MTPFDLDTTDRLLSTTRAVRKRLDLGRPVDRGTILECIELAMQAPTGSNRQGWRFLVVTDADKRERLGEIYREGGAEYLESAHKAAIERGHAQNERVFSSTLYLAENFGRVPVHVIPCIRTKLRASSPPVAWAATMGSIFPAVWSFQLALRSRGLGSVLTTLHLNHAEAAADLLGIPDDMMQVALLPVAHTIGTDFKRATRPPADTVTYWDHWGDE